jgi:hypothetical protein
MHGGMSMIEEIREVDTDIYQAYGEVMGRDIRNQQDIQHDRLPKEQAAAIACYTSDDASYLTGQMLNCSGRAVVGAIWPLPGPPFRRPTVRENVPFRCNRHP